MTNVATRIGNGLLHDGDSGGLISGGFYGIMGKI